MLKYYQMWTGNSWKDPVPVPYEGVSIKGIMRYCNGVGDPVKEKKARLKKASFADKVPLTQ